VPQGLQTLSRPALAKQKIHPRMFIKGEKLSILPSCAVPNGGNGTYRLRSGARDLDCLHLTAAIIFYAEALYEAPLQLGSELDVDGATGSGCDAGAAIVGLQKYAVESERRQDANPCILGSVTFS
jgi:hypothetical protein